MITIVLVYVGKLPVYIRECVQQIADWSSSPIYLITDDLKRAGDLLVDYVEEPKKVRLIDSKSLECATLSQLESRRSDFSVQEWMGQDRQYLFYYSLLRFYLLEACMEKYGLSRVLHLEIDNLLYIDPNQLESLWESISLGYVLEKDTQSCASMFYVRDVESVRHLNTTMLGYRMEWNSDMNWLAKYASDHPDLVFGLPYLDPSCITSGSEKYQVAWKDRARMDAHSRLRFDGMSYGLWLCGVDPIHSGGTIKRSKNQWLPEVDVTSLSYQVKRDDQGRRYYTFSIDGIEYKLANLHVHHKYLKPFMSFPYQIPSNRHIPTGEYYQSLCQVFIDVESNDPDWIPDWSSDPRHLAIDAIPIPFQNPKIVYTRGWNLNRVGEIIGKCEYPFVLVCHNADEFIKNNQGMRMWIHHPKLLAFYSTNLFMQHPKAHYLPIGLANHHWPHGKLDIIRKVRSTPLMQEKLPNSIYFFFSVETAPWIRERVKQIGFAKGLQWDHSRPYEEYLTTLQQYEYALCPAGNGPDCHRFWECLLLGVIPIVEYNPMIEYLRRWCPMVILSSFDQLDVTHLTISLPSQEERLYAEDFIPLFYTH